MDVAHLGRSGEKKDNTAVMICIPIFTNITYATCLVDFRVQILFSKCSLKKIFLLPIKTDLG